MYYTIIKSPRDCRCAEYTDLQPGCRLVVDYTNPCCKKPYCTPTTTLNPDLPTLIPPSPTTHVSTSIPCKYQIYYLS